MGYVLAHVTPSVLPDISPTKGEIDMPAPTDAK